MIKGVMGLYILYPLQKELDSVFSCTEGSQYNLHLLHGTFKFNYITIKGNHSSQD
jgi:hypothetical protein